METIDAILTRKSIRAFEEKEVEDEKIEILMKAAMAAPSAMNTQPWEFYVCKSEESKKAVKDVMAFGKYNAGIIIVPCVREMATIPTRHDLCYCDLGAASENILLAAHDLGLGAVWCAVYPDKNKIKTIRKVLKAPIGVTPYCCLYVGYPAKDDKSKVKEKYDEKRVKIL